MTDKFEIPDQLSKSFYKNALETELKIENIEIKKIDFTKGSSVGDSYASQIFQTLVTYTYDENRYTKNISLITKYMPFDGNKQFLKSMRSYEHEVKMYNEIIPKLEKLLGNNILLAPKCYHFVAEPVQTIVFQDLKATGYYVEPQYTGLDEAYSKILLKKIGKFHAASMVLANKNPDSIKFFNESMFHDQTESKIKDELFLGNLKYLEKLLNTWPGYESIAKKIGKIKNKFYEIALKVVEPQNDGVLVLNHGDLWVNNVMFTKDNNGNPIDVALIDLQLSYYGSLGIDINYFLNTSVRIDVLKSRRYELIRYYYASLKETLEKLNYSEIPSWDQIRKEISATEFYGFFAFQSILPTISLNREKRQEKSLLSLDRAKRMQIMRELSFASERIMETLKYSLDRFDELGVLNIELYLP